jgi:hypothetical protein
MLSFVFGPFGYLYVGWRYAVMTLAVFVLYFLVLALAGFTLPEWMKYIILPVLAWKAFRICSIRNAMLESGDDQAKVMNTFPIAAMAMADLLVGLGMVTAGALGLYVSGLMFMDGRIVRGLTTLIIGTPALVCITTLVFGLIADAINALFFIGAENVFRQT